jgi:hypothetical protein
MEYTISKLAASGHLYKTTGRLKEKRRKVKDISECKCYIKKKCDGRTEKQRDLSTIVYCRVNNEVIFCY